MTSIQDLWHPGIAKVGNFESTTPFYFIVPEQADKKIKLLSKKYDGINQYDMYYRYLFILHTATLDYLLFTDNPDHSKSRYKGFDYDMMLWYEILQLFEPNMIPIMLDDLCEVGLLKEYFNQYTESDNRRINLKKNSSLSILKCSPQSMFFVNKMNSTFDEIYF